MEIRKQCPGRVSFWEFLLLPFQRCEVKKQAIHFVLCRVAFTVHRNQVSRCRLEVGRTSLSNVILRKMKFHQKKKFQFCNRKTVKKMQQTHNLRGISGGPITAGAAWFYSGSRRVQIIATVRRKALEPWKCSSLATRRVGGGSGPWGLLWVGV